MPKAGSLYVPAFLFTVSADCPSPDRDEPPAATEKFTLNAIKYKCIICRTGIDSPGKALSH